MLLSDVYLIERWLTTLAGGWLLNGVHKCRVYLEFGSLLLEVYHISGSARNAASLQ